MNLKPRYGYAPNVPHSPQIITLPPGHRPPPGPFGEVRVVTLPGPPPPGMVPYAPYPGMLAFPPPPGTRRSGRRSRSRGRSRGRSRSRSRDRRESGDWHYGEPGRSSPPRFRSRSPHRSHSPNGGYHGSKYQPVQVLPPPSLPHPPPIFSGTGPPIFSGTGGPPIFSGSARIDPNPIPICFRQPSPHPAPPPGVVVEKRDDRRDSGEFDDGRRSRQWLRSRRFRGRGRTRQQSPPFPDEDVFPAYAPVPITNVPLSVFVDRLQRKVENKLGKTLKKDTWARPQATPEPLSEPNPKYIETRNPVFSPPTLTPNERDAYRRARDARESIKKLLAKKSQVEKTVFHLIHQLTPRGRQTLDIPSPPLPSEIQHLHPGHLPIKIETHRTPEEDQLNREIRRYATLYGNIERWIRRYTDLLKSKKCETCYRKLPGVYFSPTDVAATRRKKLEQYGFLKCQLCYDGEKILRDISIELRVQPDFFRRTDQEDKELERVVRRDHRWMLLELNEKIECTGCRNHIVAATFKYQHLIRYVLPARRCDDCPKAVPEQFPVIERKQKSEKPQEAQLQEILREPVQRGRERFPPRSHRRGPGREELDPKKVWHDRVIWLIGNAKKPLIIDLLPGHFQSRFKTALNIEQWGYKQVSDVVNELESLGFVSSFTEKMFRKATLTQKGTELLETMPKRVTREVAAMK